MGVIKDGCEPEIVRLFLLRVGAKAVFVPHATLQNFKESKGILPGSTGALKAIQGSVDSRSTQA